MTEADLTRSGKKSSAKHEKRDYCEVALGLLDQEQQPGSGAVIVKTVEATRVKLTGWHSLFL